MRASAQTKNNLAMRGPLQAFGFESDGGFVGLGENEVTVEELLRDRKKPDSQFIKARRLIESALAKGPVPAADMMEMAEEQGISPKTLSRAKEALGVISSKRGVKRYWELPIDVTYTEVSHDGHHGQACRDDHSHSGGATAMTTLTTLTTMPCGGGDENYGA